MSRIPPYRPQPEQYAATTTRRRATQHRCGPKSTPEDCPRDEGGRFASLSSQPASKPEKAKAEEDPNIAGQVKDLSISALEREYRSSDTTPELATALENEVDRRLDAENLTHLRTGNTIFHGIDLLREAGAIYTPVDAEAGTAEEERSFAFADQARRWSAGQLETAYGSGGVNSEMRLALEDELNRRLAEEGLPPIDRNGRPRRMRVTQAAFSEAITRLVDAMYERRRSNREEDAGQTERNRVVANNMVSYLDVFTAAGLQSLNKNFEEEVGRRLEGGRQDYLSTTRSMTNDELEQAPLALRDEITDRLKAAGLEPEFQKGGGGSEGDAYYSYVGMHNDLQQLVDAGQTDAPGPPLGNEQKTERTAQQIVDSGFPTQLTEGEHVWSGYTREELYQHLGHADASIKQSEKEADHWRGKEGRQGEVDYYLQEAEDMMGRRKEIREAIDLLEQRQEEYVEAKKEVSAATEEEGQRQEYDEEMERLNRQRVEASRKDINRRNQDRVESARRTYAEDTQEYRDKWAQLESTGSTAEMMTFLDETYDEQIATLGVTHNISGLTYNTRRKMEEQLTSEILEWKTALSENPSGEITVVPAEMAEETVDRQKELLKKARERNASPSVIGELEESIAGYDEGYGVVVTMREHLLASSEIDQIADGRFKFYSRVPTNADADLGRWNLARTQLWTSMASANEYLSNVYEGTSISHAVAPVYLRPDQVKISEHQGPTYAPYMATGTVNTNPYSFARNWNPAEQAIEMGRFGLLRDERAGGVSATLDSMWPQAPGMFLAAVEEGVFNEHGQWMRFETLAASDAGVAESDVLRESLKETAQSAAANAAIESDFEDILNSALTVPREENKQERQAVKEFIIDALPFYGDMGVSHREAGARAARNQDLYEDISKQVDRVAEELGPSGSRVLDYWEEAGFDFNDKFGFSRVIAYAALPDDYSAALNRDGDGNAIDFLTSAAAAGTSLPNNMYDGKVFPTKEAAAAYAEVPEDSISALYLFPEDLSEPVEGSMSSSSPYRTYSYVEGNVNIDDVSMARSSSLSDLTTRIRTGGTQSSRQVTADFDDAEARVKKTREANKSRDAHLRKLQETIDERQRQAAATAEQIRYIPEPTALASGASTLNRDYADVVTLTPEHATALDNLNISTLDVDSAGHDIATLVGAADDAEVMWAIDSWNDDIDVSITGTGYSASRTIADDGDIKYMSNDRFFVDKEYQGQGIGIRQLARQVQWGKRWGFDEIRVSAIGRGEGSEYETGRKKKAGYHVWAKFGFNADIRSGTRKKAIKDGFKDVTDIHSLMLQPGGSDWWLENGHSFNGKFDLRPGSVSNKIMSEYLRRKVAEGSLPEKFQKQHQQDKPRMRGYEGETIDVTDADIALLDAIWQDLMDGKLEDKPRMRTKEEYAKAHCGPDATPTDCPRDEGGKFSSKQSSGKPKMQTAEERGQTWEKLGVTEEDNAEWRKKHKVKQKQKPVPAVRDAAAKLNAGELTQKQYIATVRKEMPIKPFTEVPELPSVEDVVFALKKKQANTGIVGVSPLHMPDGKLREIEDGDLVSSRLDIPAYENFDTWVVSLHDGSKVGGKSIGYAQTAILSDVTFNSSAKGALNIATGKKSKGTIARIFGKWETHTPEDAHKQAQELLNDPEWTQVGMNPYRHSWFYDKTDGTPVVAADKVIQVGALVLAKNVTTAPVDDDRFKFKTSTGDTEHFAKPRMFTREEYARCGPDASPSECPRDEEGKFSSKEGGGQRGGTQQLFEFAEPPSTPEFKRWFGDSKVVDESGKPLVVYHGTDKEDLDVMYDGWFSDDIEATEEFGPVVVKAYLKMENPAYDLSSVTREPGDLADLYKEYSGEEFDFWGDSNLRDVATTDVRGGFREWLIAKGYDGIVTYDDSNRVTATSYVPFSPSQIKSVENKGSFDPDDPRINYSRPRMYTKEEYARKNHHCGVDADPSGCPRDEGGKFSSKQGSGTEEKTSRQNAWKQPREEYIQADAINAALGELGDYEDPNKQKIDALLDKSRELRYEWEASVEYALSMGLMTGKDARDAGYHNGHIPSDRYTNEPRIEPLPKKLWHVTTAADKVREEGLKSRDELGMGSGVGLGGGESSTISFTDSPQTARAIKASLIEAHKYATGEIGPSDILRAAEEGIIHKHLGDDYEASSERVPFIDKIMGDKWLETGETHEDFYKALITGKQVKEPFPPVSPDDESGKKLLAEGWKATPVSREYLLVNSWEWTRPVEDDPDYEWRRFQLYKAFAGYRESVGGALDPLFFQTDVKAFAALDREQIQVVEAEPTKNAHGYQVSALGEWRTFTGEAVEAKGFYSRARQRMYTHEEYARQKFRCDEGATEAECPRDDGGRFSSKSSGKSDPIVDKPATTKLESAIGGAEDGRAQKDSAAGVGGEEAKATQVRAEEGVVSERARVPRGVDELPSSLRSTIEAPALAGLPTNISIPGYDDAKIGPYITARQAAAVYMNRSGLSYSPPTTYQKVDKDRAKKIADEFESIKHDPTDPTVQASYQAMIDETVAQWQVIKETGLQVEWITEEMLEKSGDPYAATPRLATEDIRRNNHFYVFPTDFGFGSDEELDVSDNPLLAYTDEIIGGKRARANDVFRVVHDYFGHVKEGNGFRAGGEENAWRAHSSMYSDLARPAMTMETRGQNSWVNFGPHGETNRTASGEDTHYAPQKINLLSDWVTTDGAGDSAAEPDTESYSKFDESKHKRDEDGKFATKQGTTKTPERTKEQIEQTKKNAQAKYNRVASLSTRFGDLVSKSSKDMASKERTVAEAAAVMRLILETGMRPGYRGHKRETPSYGATSLLARHVKQNGNTYLEYKGKKQVDRKVDIRDKMLASFLSKRASQAEGAESRLFNVSAEKLRSYARLLAGQDDAKVKDFRTLIGTMAAKSAIQSLAAPSTLKQYKSLVKKVAQHVASILGNTPAVALQSYIDPRVFTEWKENAEI